jgi:hypothetical protein
MKMISCSYERAYAVNTSAVFSNLVRREFRKGINVEWTWFSERREHMWVRREM